MEISIEVQAPRGIKESHWLNEERYAWFKRGYEYASTQNLAIPALSGTSPTQLYFAVTAIMRGAGIDEPKHATT